MGLVFSSVHPAFQLLGRWDLDRCDKAVQLYFEKWQQFGFAVDAPRLASLTGLTEHQCGLIVSQLSIPRDGVKGNLVSILTFLAAAYLLADATSLSKDESLERRIEGIFSVFDLDCDGMQNIHELAITAFSVLDALNVMMREPRALEMQGPEQLAAHLFSVFGLDTSRKLSKMQFRNAISKRVSDVDELRLLFQAVDVVPEQQAASQSGAADAIAETKPASRSEDGADVQEPADKVDPFAPRMNEDKGATGDAREEVVSRGPAEDKASAANETKLPLGEEPGKSPRALEGAKEAPPLAEAKPEDSDAEQRQGKGEEEGKGVQPAGSSVLSTTATALVDGVIHTAVGLASTPSVAAAVEPENTAGDVAEDENNQVGEEKGEEKIEAE